MNYSINGRFTVREYGGQERFSYEMLYELDKIVEQGFVELVVPEYAQKLPELKNIKIVKYGNVKSHFWEQINFFWYLIKNKRIGINPCITCPILKPDIVTLHDIGQLINKQYYTNIYGKLSRQWHKIMFKSSAKFAKMIFTVSNFSKDEIVKYLGVDPSKIVVVGNGWQHINNVQEDESIFVKHQEILRKKYYLSASSLTPQKNFRWVKEVAKHNKDCQFVVIGKKVGLTGKADDINSDKNLIYLGRVSDGELKTLMKNCKAFIHPAFYEGFGLTPMEALSQGAKIIISNTSCLPEIYENSAYYINPNEYNINLDELLMNKVDSPNIILKKYSWTKTANKVYEALIYLQNK